MLCQSCGKNTANTYIKTIVNGELTERRLCSQCAAKMGYNSMLGGLSMGNLLAGLFGDPSSTGLPIKTASKRCGTCGSTFQDIVSSGKVGCADCYTLYREDLTPTIQRIHGNTRHVGKVPGSMGSKAALKNELEELRRKLQEAVQAQNYEQAAILRDRIRDKEKEVGANE